LKWAGALEFNSAEHEPILGADSPKWVIYSSSAPGAFNFQNFGEFFKVISFQEQDYGRVIFQRNGYSAIPHKIVTGYMIEGMEFNFTAMMQI